MRDTGQLVRFPAWQTFRWRVVRPLAWQIAGLRDRAATARANRRRDIV